MANDNESFPDPNSQKLAQREIAKEAIEGRESPPRIALNTTASVDIQGDVTVNSRAYQLEMLEESLKRNTIVTMDTGSGKTHVAVLRIKSELEIAAAQKFIWFLAPTVGLCSQQFHLLQSQISSVQIKSFTSADNVDRWTEKADWDAELTNVNLVVSTYAILHNALCKGFVSMESLALVVFDEAHNCIGRSPGSKIMQDFYWPRKKDELSVPHILGLTASPVIGSKVNALKTLELLLDSTCKGPRLQKEELLRHVNRPILTQIKFEGNEVNVGTPSRTYIMESLVAVHESLNIYDDPGIIRLRTRNTEASNNQMERALRKNKTFIQDQLKSFSRRSEELHRTLGSWAADFYISQVISSCIQSADSKDTRFFEWEDSEKQYLANALRNVDIAPQNLSALSENSISHKVRALINFLHSCDENVIGIIFVKERAVAYMLHRLLSDHPETCHRLCFDTVVGTSQRPRGKRDICELPNPGDALAKFRSGETNILIATSVLEEGIDVPQCKLVICFDEPATLKSYIQCRGRARLQESKWVMLLDTTSKMQSTQWEGLEREIKLCYEEEERHVQRFAETQASETMQCRNRQFKVPNTGALLDMDNAKENLQRFCSRLSSHSSVQMRPEYIIREEEDVKGEHNDQPLLSAKVILPATLDSSLRVSKSTRSWRSEKNATKDAAFEAVVALYHAGLLNDRLLPLSFAVSSKYMEKRESIVEAHEQFNPWPRVAHAWKSEERLRQRALTLKDENGLTKCKVEMLIPTDLPDMEPIVIYWDASIEWRIEIGSPTNDQQSKLTADHTTSLLTLAYGHRWEVEEMGHVVLFKAGDMDVSQKQRDSDPLIPQGCMDDSVGLIRDTQNRGHPYLYHSTLLTKPSIKSIQAPCKDYESFPDDQPFVALEKWSRRSDFLHPVSQGQASRRQEYFTVLPQSLLRMDTVPTACSEFGLLIPYILHKVEVQLVAEELCTTVLAGLGISSSELIRTAISAPVARERDNYQKLEFLGDSVLKLLVSIFVSSKYAHWPEGYLSAKKDTIVSNSRLCKAALECSLDKFILTKAFTGRSWRPLYIDKLLENQEDGTRKMSSKTIADVVESLIGAGWKIGGFPTSLSIAKLFLPEIDLPSFEVGRARLFDLAPAGMQLPANLQQLETLVGYSFKKKSLLIQAMSHSSYNVNTTIASYERLEFLGDTILETIIVTELLAYEDKLSHSLMHLYKTALVNGDYLGFVSLEWNITQTRTDLKEDLESGCIEKVESQFSLPLWRFMKHGSFDIGNQQREMERRHASLRRDILQAIASGTDYPWALLAKLHANKFYSDVVESLLGAVWVDSGSMDTCKQLLKRMGILQYLHRIVEDRVHVLHPKEELGILADDKEVRYDVQVQKMDDRSDEWTCVVFVGETPVSEVHQGVSDDEVRTRAAEEAVSFLKFANGRSGSQIAYGERITRHRHA